jgi:hypothetical protein
MFLEKRVEIDTVGGYISMPLWEYFTIMAFAPILMLIITVMIKYLL